MLLATVLELESEIEILRQENESLLNDIQIREVAILTLAEELDEYRNPPMPESASDIETPVVINRQAQRMEPGRTQEELEEALGGLVDATQELGRSVMRDIRIVLGID